MKKYASFPYFLFFSLFFSFSFPVFAQLPEGFVDEPVAGDWDYIVGFVFDESGGMYGWERAGRLYQVKNDVKQTTPILDIAEEVGYFGDHGLLSIALHPNFLNNGYVYLLYAVDRHHLLYHGTSAYDPNTSVTKEASIGRVTRYTLSKVDSFRSVVAGSRKVLLGASIGDGIPLLHTSHGVGDLLFGYDGSLLVSAGDGSTYETEFIGGGREGTYAQQAINDGIMPSKEDVGSYRSQLVDSHSGKILRLDPETGEGLPSNPFFDANAPASARSRVWALGFRNPFRMSLVPETGSHNMEDGEPGVIYVGDVGGGNWEELNVVDAAGQNFGWPLWEGFEAHWGFWGKPADNPDAPNPLANGSGCDRAFFSFHNLILEDQQSPFPYWENPCDPAQEIPADLARFLHSRPTLSYNNFLWNPPTETRVGTYNNEGNAQDVLIGEAPWQVEGEMFDGICIIDGLYYKGESFPETYQDRYFFADFDGWIKILDFDSLHRPTRVESFQAGLGNLTHLDVNPSNGCLYYVRFKNQKVRKICYGTDPAPLVNLKIDRNHGPSPLTVRFDASASRDLKGQPISFAWDFGDGSRSTDTVISHTFIAEHDEPTSFQVSLTVTDTAGKATTEDVIISLNNTPPTVFITSIEDNGYYATSGMNVVALEAEVTDAEHSNDELRYEWQTLLLHNSHFHPEPIDTQQVTQSLLEPAGCDDEYYAYRISLKVYDKAGLFGSHEISLWPNCDSFPVGFTQLQADFEADQVVLDWATDWEENVSHYVVERAPDQLHFEPMRELSAQGSGNYQWIDDAAHLGLNVYRLKIYTQEGKYHYSAPVEVETYKGLGIELYPNPTVSIIAFRFAEMKEMAQFELFELNGKSVYKTVWQGQGRAFEQINVSHLQGGIYYYRLRNGSDEMNGKIVIAK